MRHALAFSGEKICVLGGKSFLWSLLPMFAVIVAAATGAIPRGSIFFEIAAGYLLLASAAWVLGEMRKPWREARDSALEQSSLWRLGAGVVSTVRERRRCSMWSSRWQGVSAAAMAAMRLRRPARRASGRQRGASPARRSAAGAKASADDGGDGGGEPPHRQQHEIIDDGCCTLVGGAA